MYVDSWWAARSPLSYLTAYTGAVYWMPTGSLLLASDLDFPSCQLTDSLYRSNYYLAYRRRS